MQRSYKPLAMKLLKPRASFVTPGGGTPSSVSPDSPAISVMTDLFHVAVATISAETPVAKANQVMIVRAIRLLLVVDSESVVTGVVTVRDTMGEKPIKLLKEIGGKHDELTVAHVMTPLSAVEVLDMEAVMSAKVGNIVETLKSVGRQHALVVDKDTLSGKERVRGIFSATQIGRQLGVAIHTFEVARTFAEIEAALHR